MSVNGKKISDEPAEQDIENIKKLINSNQSSKAEIITRDLLIKYPKSTKLLNVLGVSLIVQNKLAEAEKNYLKLIDIKPSYADALNNLANIYMKLNKIDDAIKYLKIAVSKKPGLDQAYFNLARIYTSLGNSFYKKKEIEESIINYKKAIEYKSDYFEAYNNLGVSLAALEKDDDSIISFENAIKLNSNYFEAYNNLGNVLIKKEKIVNAIKSYQKAINIKADYAEAYNNLGIALDKSGKFDEAIKNYKHAIEIRPNFTKAYNNLAASFVQQGKFDEAIKNYNKVLELNPENKQYAINAKLLLPTIPESQEHLKFWRNKFILAIDELKKNKYLIDNPQKTINPPTFNLAYSNFNNLEIIKKISDFFRNEIPIINFRSKKIGLYSKKNKRIKLGFISEFFTDHTIGKLYKGLVFAIDKSKFELIIFHTSNTKNGKIKNEIEKHAEKVINLSEKITFQQKQIENEELDILFFPDIGMTSSTYFLAYGKFAPIQIVGFGHPETTGIDTIDYFLSSSLIESKDSNSFYSEKLICLEPVLMNFIPPEKPQIKLERSDFGISKEKNLYCCPQTLFKIHPDFDLALAKIAEKDPNSQIIMIQTKFKFHAESLKKRWVKNFPKLVDKVLFLESMSLEKFLSLIKISDVLLDPFYFGSGLSFAESMIYGTPTITMPTTFMRSRLATGMYKQMNITNAPIASDVDHFIELAIKLAKDKNANNILRENLKNAAKLHLFNNLESIKKFENFLLEVYGREKKRPN